MRLILEVLRYIGTGTIVYLPQTSKMALPWKICVPHHNKVSRNANRVRSSRDVLEICWARSQHGICATHIVIQEVTTVSVATCTLTKYDWRLHTNLQQHWEKAEYAFQIYIYRYMYITKKGRWYDLWSLNDKIPFNNEQWTIYKNIETKAAECKLQIFSRN